MNRLNIPTFESSPDASQPLLEAVKKQLGVIPNLMKLIGNSPAALEGYLSLNGALSKGTLGAKTGERIALAIAEFNRCDYCLSAHTYLATNVAKLDVVEVNANRLGESTDPKANAAVRFALSIAQQKGHVSNAKMGDIKAAGFSDAQIIEIILHVALNTLTNYVNSVAQTVIDFPKVHAYPV